MCGLTGKPAERIHSRVWLCEMNSGPPSIVPNWYAQNPSSRLAVTAGSFCRNDPAPALRGFMNVRAPAEACRRLSSSKAGIGM